MKGSTANVGKNKKKRKRNVSLCRRFFSKSLSVAAEISSLHRLSIKGFRQDHTTQQSHNWLCCLYWRPVNRRVNLCQISSIMHCNHYILIIRIVYKPVSRCTGFSFDTFLSLLVTIEILKFCQFLIVIFICSEIKVSMDTTISSSNKIKYHDRFMPKVTHQFEQKADPWDEWYSF